MFTGFGPVQVPLLLENANPLFLTPYANPAIGVVPMSQLPPAWHV